MTANSPLSCRSSASRLRSRAVAATLAALTAMAPGPCAFAAASADAKGPDFGRVAAPSDVTRVATWAVRGGDAQQQPFAIIDKRHARLYVFDGAGKLTGTSAVLLGHAVGDTSVPGIGDRPLAQIQPHERTTPAGRFVSEPGQNLQGHDIVWVDYDAAVSMHRVRASNPAERRLERLATPSVRDNRISWGCINVPVAFFDNTVWPALGQGRALVYVLPEQLPLKDFFPAAAL